MPNGWQLNTADNSFEIDSRTDIQWTADLSLPPELPPVSLLSFSVTGNKVINFSGELRFITCTPVGAKREPLTIMETAPFFHNLRYGDVDANLSWQGKEDLNGKLSAARDQENLHLYLDATDDMYYQVRTDSGIWEGDSLQVAFSNLKGKDTQIGIALANDGHRVM